SLKTSIKTITYLSDTGCLEIQGASLVNIGYMYKHGQGVEKDYQAAFEWFTKAAECNDATAWYNLAIMYHYGEGRPVDLRQALDLYRKVQSSGTRDVSQEIRETEDLL
ncbi:tetratricopeptide repeat protein, partial [Shigella sonnei]|uniref:tetratricopeptide repeat protein n=1 Tax=Shigella sonnei TaxID=624 RepID=UPI00339B3A54|nr:tetratricopeptide repeat protein [Shigella sonnei]MDD0707396.1 tetratricopeptide repeat protein [Shigella sonnei]